MEEAFIKAEELAGHIKEYVNNRIDSVKLTAAEKSSKVAANIIAAVCVAVTVLFFIAFASIALAYAVAEWTGKLYWGFLAVAGFYLILSFLIWIAREKWLHIPIMNSILEQLFKDEEDEED